VEITPFRVGRVRRAPIIRRDVSRSQSLCYGGLCCPYFQVFDRLSVFLVGMHVCILRLYKVIGTQPQPLLWLAEMGELGLGWSLCSEGSQTEAPVRNTVGPLLMDD
jgi:hypothetical protein